MSQSVTSDPTSIADASTVVMRNTSDVQYNHKYNRSSSSAAAAAAINRSYTDEELTIANNLRERKKNEGSRRALLMDHPNAHDDDNDNDKTDTDDCSSSASVETGAAVKSLYGNQKHHKSSRSKMLPSVNEDDVMVVESNANGNGKVKEDTANGTSDENESSLLSLLNFSKPIVPRSSSLGRKKIVFAFIVMFAVIGMIVAILFGAGVFEDDSSGDVQEGLGREDYINVFADISPRNLLDTEGTDQYRALDWIMSVDKLNVTDDEARLKQRYTLCVFFYSLNGEDWLLNTSWLDGNEDECIWYGVTCGQDQHMIERIEIESNMLEGSLPEEFAKGLPTLSYFNLGQNRINGSLSKNFADLRNLSVLSLWDNTLSGTIPIHLFDISKLKILNLKDNALSGSIHITIDRLEYLEELDLGGNRLDANIPSEIGQVKNLRRLDLTSNFLVYSIPSTIGLLTSLEYMLLSNNALTGTIPSEIVFLQSLVQLRLDSNDLDGLVPSTIGNITSLTLLKINDNMLSGSIPSSLCYANATISADCGINNTIICECCTTCFD